MFGFCGAALVGPRLVWPHHQSRAVAQDTGVQSSGHRHVPDIRRRARRGAAARTSAAIRYRRRWSSPASSLPSRRPPWPSCWCCGFSRKAARLRSSPDDTDERTAAERRLMMPGLAVLTDATRGGILLPLAIILPVIGILLSFVLGGRHAERIALLLLPAGLVVAASVFFAGVARRPPLVYLVGDWQPPLGIALRADGVSAAMMVTIAVVICATACLRARISSTARPPRSSRAVRVLDAAAGDLGRAQYDLSSARSVQALRRAGAVDIRRGAAGLPGGRCGNHTGRAALPALRPARLGAVSARHGADLRQLWHAGHRAVVATGRIRSRSPGSRPR